MHKLMDDELARAEKEMEGAITEAKDLVTRMTEFLDENGKSTKEFLETQKQEVKKLAEPRYAHADNDSARDIFKPVGSKNTLM